MAFFDNLKESAVRAARITGEKSKELAAAAAEKGREVAEITKHSFAINGLEDDIKQTYLELGKRYYAEKSAEPDASFAELCAKIGACMGEIAEHRARIAELKADEDDKAEDACCCEGESCECSEEGCCCGKEPETPACTCGCQDETPKAE